MAFPACFRRDGRPFVLGHRGASSERPENTLEAFQLALAQGADGVELDVHRCATGEVVVVHDPDLKRVSGHPVEVARTPWNVLRGIDVGSWFRPTFAACRVPTLEQVIEALGPQALVNVELKGNGKDPAALAAATVAVLARAPHVERFVVSSFHPLLLRRFGRGWTGEARPALALLFEPKQLTALTPVFVGKRLRADGLHPAWQQCTPDNVKRWHGQGFAVATWTVDDPSRALALREAGVEGLVTNRPKDILAAFAAKAA